MTEELNCGDAFCDVCGDCIYCYGDDPCSDGGDHQYQVTQKEPEWHYGCTGCWRTIWH